MQGYSLLESYDHYNVISAFCNRKNKTVSKAKKTYSPSPVLSPVQKKVSCAIQ
jgi:hypothetical protein